MGIVRVAFVGLLPVLCSGVSLRRQRSKRGLDLAQLQNLEKQLINAARTKQPADEVTGSDDLAEGYVSDNLLKHVVSAVHDKSSETATVGTMTADQVQEVLDEMKNTTLDQHNASKKQAQDLIGAFASCTTNLQSTQANLVSDKATVTTKGTTHESCRTQEGKDFTAKDTCNTELEGLLATKKALCDAVESIKEDPGTAADVCHSQGETYGGWLKRNRAWFVLKDNEFNEAVEACNNATAKVDAKTPICHGLDKTWGSKKAECGGMQDQFESATCSYDVAASAICSNFDNCWGNAMSNYNEGKFEIQQAVAVRKAQWRAVMRMECLVGTFEESDQDEAIDTCINTTHNTSFLDITIAAPPQEPECKDDDPAACTAEFVSVHYSGLPVGGQADDCSPCAINGAFDSGNPDWVPILKISKSDTQEDFGYDSPLWTNDKVYKNSAELSSTQASSKYFAFLSTPFDTMRICVGAPESNCVELQLGQTWQSAKELFSAGYVAMNNLPQQDILNLFDVPMENHQYCQPVKPGFNVECTGTANSGGAAGYIGCYKDSWDRDLPVLIGNPMTTESCASACSDYKYFGMQSWGFCFCGNSYGKHGPSDGCHCDGPHVGPWVNCVYSTTGGSGSPGVQGNKARFGWCGRPKAEGCSSASTYGTIGVGLEGLSDYQSAPGHTYLQQGSGYTNLFTGLDKQAKEPQATWLWVKPNAPPSTTPVTTVEDGWTLIMKVSKQDEQLGYFSWLWENDQLLNPASNPMNMFESAKYEAFLNTPFTELRVNIAWGGFNAGKSVMYSFNKTWANATELFKAGYWGQGEVPGTDYEEMFLAQPQNYQSSCPAIKAGINVQCKGGNNVRIGHCRGCSGQACTDEAQSVIGVGLKGKATSGMGAGWSNYFHSAACEANSMAYRGVRIWVK